MPKKQKEITEYLTNHYNSWKQEYLQECGGNLRPGVNPLTRSLVEAQGFSMVAVAYMGDKEIFDKLFNFYKSKCVNTSCGLRADRRPLADETLELGIHYWYSAYLGNLYLLALSGNMWTPEIIDEQTRNNKVPSGNTTVQSLAFPSVTITPNRTLLISNVPGPGVIKLLRLSGETTFRTTVARGATSVSTGFTGRGCCLLLYVNALTGQKVHRIVSIL